MFFKKFIRIKSMVCVYYVCCVRPSDRNAIVAMYSK